MSDTSLFAGALAFGVSVLVGYAVGEAVQSWMKRRNDFFSG